MPAEEAEAVSRHHDQIRIPGSLRFGNCPRRVIGYDADAVRGEVFEIGCQEGIQLCLPYRHPFLGKGVFPHAHSVKHRDLGFKPAREGLNVVGRTNTAIGEITGNKIFLICGITPRYRILDSGGTRIFLTSLLEPLCWSLTAYQSGLPRFFPSR